MSFIQHLWADRKWRRQAIVVAAAVTALIAVLITSNIVAGPATPTSAKSTSTTSAAPAAPVTPTVVAYKLAATTSYGLNVTLQTPTGMSQDSVTPPHSDIDQTPRIEFHGFGPGAFLYVSAQNQGEFGTIRCQIWVDDTLISDNVSSGAYSIVTCKGSM